jgi:hypothetical protein
LKKAPTPTPPTRPIQADNSPLDQPAATVLFMRLIIHADSTAHQNRPRSADGDLAGRPAVLV